jgi:hypothetical protein
MGEKVEKALVDIVVTAATLYFTGGSAATWAGAFKTATALTTLNYAAGGYDYLDAPGGLGAEVQGRQQNVKLPTQPRRTVYGENKVGGTVVFLETSDDNKYLHMVLALADHEVFRIGEPASGFFQSYDYQGIYLNDAHLSLADAGNDANGVTRYEARDAWTILGFDEPAGNAFYDDGKSYVRFKLHDGTQTQADADLVAETSAPGTMVLNGIAYIYARFEWNADAFPNGIPAITAKVKGKKVYDPRTSTTAYSDNPALIVRDYLTSASGLAAGSSEIDDTSVTAAANICDETVTNDDAKYPYTSSSSRYTANGTVQSDASPSTILPRLLSSMVGDCVFSDGKWTVLAGAYRTPTITLDEDDLRGAISVQTRASRRDSFNTVKGVFVSPQDNYQPTDFPEITNATYVTEDNGEKVTTELDLPFTNDTVMAQRIAKIHLEKGRQQLVITYPAKLTAFKLQVGDTVMVTNERFGFSSKVFEVIEWTLAVEQAEGGTAFGVDLVLRETASAIYTWSSNEQVAVDPAPNTTLPSAYTVDAPGVSIDEELRIVNQKAVAVISVTVTGGGTFADQYEVQFKKSTDTEYKSLGRGASNVFDIIDVEDNVTYNIRARAISTLGVKSAFTNFNHQAVGKTAPPANVTGLRINVVGAEAHLSWDAVADLDLSHYIVKFTANTASPVYNNAQTLIPKVTATSVTVPARTGTYFVRAVDTSGNRSLSPTSVGTDIQAISGINLVATSTQHPAFAGTKTDVVIDEDSQDVPVLKLATAILFDAKTGNFDDADGFFDGGGGEVDDAGSYEFDTYVDLGSKYTSRVTADMDVVRLDYVNLFDDAEGLFDDRQGLFDGGQSVDDTTVSLFVALTNDDPAGSPTWSDWKEFVVGDYTARALKFKADLISLDEQATPAIRELSVTVDMPDRITADNDIASGTAAGGKAVTFNPAFKDLQGLAIVAENMATGDFYDIVSKDATGFTIRFKNSGGTVVDRTFDYVAKGYGELVV